MAVFLTDEQIEAHVRTPKTQLPPLSLKPQRGGARAEYKAVGDNGQEYRVSVRQSTDDPDNFSIIVAWCPVSTNERFHLRRYNGSNHEHSNPIERTRIVFECHIHQATERYQLRGGDVERYAEATTRYHDLDGAWRCMLVDCGFPLPAGHPRLPGMDDV